MPHFPCTSRAFSLNGKEFVMYKHTLLLLSKIEDESVYVSYADAVGACTNMSESDMKDLTNEQFEEVYESIAEFSKPDEPAESDGDIRAVEVIASLMNKGHMDAQHYRTDFVEVVIKEYLRGVEDSEEKTAGNDDEDDNETKMKGLFGNGS